MDENNLTSIETEVLKRDSKETLTQPPSTEAAAGPDLKRAEAPNRAVEATDNVAPVASIPQYSSELSFACLLIPRFSDHYLMGDIVDSLTVWMKQACISFGWRLDALSIRPGYMQWIMQVPLDASPARFMKLIRRSTSEQIFEDFPRFKQKNLSGEFWAPGNFVVPGNQLQTPEQVNELMLQTRRQQGIV